jgi:hypothetical protein
MNAIRSSLERARQAGLRGRKDEGIALVSVMLFMILLAGMSLVLLSVILGQMGPAYVAQKSTNTVYAAQAGLQSALGVVRSASGSVVNGEVYGDPRKLPCSFSGGLDGVSNDVSYDVTLQYFSVDPTGRTEPWLSANDIACSPPPVGVSVAPKYAYIVSAGKGVSAAGRPAGEATRSVAAVYKFMVTNVNIPGGRVWDTGHNMCLEAVTATVGSKLKFVSAGNCTTPAKQLWVYDVTYQIKLSSTTVAPATPLCISGVSVQDAVLARCEQTDDPDRWNQIWSWNDNAQWQGQKQDISAGVSGGCLVIGAADGGGTRYLRVNGCSGSLDPDPAVGAGAAGYATRQIVNYKEFGRCADVTNREINYDYMIVYPCKQDASGAGAFSWNHKWFYTEPPVRAAPTAAQPNPPYPFTTGEVYVNDGGGAKKCLVARGQTDANRDVEFASCTNGNNQIWTRFMESSSQNDRYTFKDYWGRCLTAETAGAHGGLYSIMRMAACDGSAAQKWNAPATLTESVVGGFKELG